MVTNSLLVSSNYKSTLDHSFSLMTDEMRMLVLSAGGNFSVDIIDFMAQLRLLLQINLGISQRCNMLLSFLV